MSTQSDNTIYLISGANRGVGLALVKAILETQPNAFVYAGARNVEGATALKELEKKYPERISTVQCVSADVEGNAALAREIEGRHGRLDTVVANAAISEIAGPVVETPLSNLEDHFRINVSGPIVLFQATYALLKKSSNPKFIPISSQAGSIDGITIRAPTAGGIGYGSSKAALNWATRKIHFENEWLTAFPLSPGMVDTDMLQAFVAKDTSGAFAQYLPFVARPEDAALGVLKVIVASNRAEFGGEFFNVDGNKADW